MKILESWRKWLGVRLERAPRRRTIRHQRAIQIEGLESRLLLSATSRTNGGFTYSSLQGEYRIGVAFGEDDERATTVEGTMEMTVGSNEKIYRAHFVLPGYFDCVLERSSKFSQIKGFTGKAVDTATGVKIKFKTELESVFKFTGTVKVGKQKGTIVGDAVDTDPF